MKAQLEELEGPRIETFQCAACAADFGNVKPEKCTKCGSYVIEKITRLNTK